jgi:hypothetical protein
VERDGERSHRTWTRIRRDRLTGLSAEELGEFQSGRLRAETSLDSSSPVFGEDSWHGGFYELAIVLGGVTDPGSNDRLSAAIRSSWSHDSCLGPFAQRGFTLTTEPSLLNGRDEIDERLYGALLLPYGLAPLTVVVREESGHDNLDWLYVACPVGGLSEIHPDVGGYPFEPYSDTDTWREPLDSLLIDIARHIHSVARFQRAYIDFEVAGDDCAGTPVAAESLFVRDRIVQL